MMMEYLLYFMSILSLTFWVVIWVMHICALTNAKLKLNKRSYTSPTFGRNSKHCNGLQFTKQTATATKVPLYPPPTAINKQTFNPTPTPVPAPRVAEPPFSQQQLEQQQELQKQHCQHDQQLNQPLNHDDNNRNKNQYSYINLPLPGVSIIKPLVGIDANLYKNLETFFRMDYPTYELLFCVEDPGDAAILIVNNLFKLYPNVDARLFIGGSRVGVNPKINNMQPAYEATKYELVLISDSGISMKKDTLLDMVGYMEEDVALVHQMPFVCDGRQGFQSVVEKVYFGTAHARAYLTADLLNINCPTGMSALMRKYLLDEVGGIRAFGQYLAEDFFFAKSFTDRGWKISISSQPAWQNSANSSDTLSTLNSRIQRWVKLRFAMVPQWTLLEPFSECMLLGLLGAMSISFLWALDPYAIFLFHVLLWFLFDYKLLCTIQNGPLTFSKTDFIIAWLIRESTALLIFLKALATSKVTWRSRIFKLKWGGYAEEVFPPNNLSFLCSIPTTPGAVANNNNMSHTNHNHIKHNNDSLTTTILPTPIQLPTPTPNINTATTTIPVVS